jgi:ribosomal-protein-alanine N-acetyltransferase
METECLILRRFTADDAEQYLPLVSDPDINRYTGQALVQTVDEARQMLLDHPIREYAQHGYGRMACIEKSSGRLVGFSGVKYLAFLQEVEVGFRFLRDSWGKGYATESASVLMRESIREFGLRRVIGLTDAQNTASVHALKKLGLSYERQIRGERYPGLLDLYALDCATL